MHTLARRFAILAAVLPLAGAAPNAMGQNAEPAAATQRNTAATLFSVDFPGGTVGELADAIRDASENATIVVSEDAAGWRVPSMQFRRVDLLTVGRMIGQVAAPPTSAPGLRMAVLPSQVAGTSDHAISVSIAPDFSIEERKIGTRTWSVREHLNGGLPADDLLSAVQAMVETEPGDSTIRFHEPTALLIIRGSEAQLTLVSDGLEQLRAEVRQDQNRADTVLDDIAQIEDRLVEARGELRIAEKQVEVARASLKQMQDAVSEGVAPAVAVAEAELQVVRADAEFEVAARRVQRFTEALGRLRQRLDE
jgi:hypothetical protein